MKKTLIQLKPKNIEDITAVISLITVQVPWIPFRRISTTVTTLNPLNIKTRS